MAEKEKLLNKYNDPKLADLTPEAEERGVRSLIAALMEMDREEKEFWARVEEDMEDMSRIEKKMAEFEKKQMQMNDET